MRYLSWLSGILLFVLALGFAVKNSEIVTLHYYLGYQWQAPLVVVLLAVFCIGAGVGIAATLGLVFQQRREITRLRRAMKSRPQAAEVHASKPLAVSQTPGQHSHHNGI